ncbi:hypothetical protein AN641_04470 [Candidatus Epulonipiscioides gigas]|nr:hypothetical protein AN641_04470 [Epulopiscium sp. SCG-C07WGA-EpuloA2]
MDLEIFIGPVIGGIIGYITNSIAIKMLFRPINPIIIFGKTLPFTPGMIPKEQKRIGTEVGRLIEEELIDISILKSRLLSTEICERIEQTIKTVLQSAVDSKTTVEDYIVDILTVDQLEYYKIIAIQKISSVIADKIKDSNVGDTIVDEIFNVIQDSIGAFTMFVGDSFIDGISQKAKVIVNKVIEERAYDQVLDIMNKETDEFMQKPIGELTEHILEYEDLIIQIVLNTYENFIENQLILLLKKINLANIVEEKIISYSPKKLEELILSVVKKELTAIIYFGVILGAIIGFII